MVNIVSTAPTSQPTYYRPGLRPTRTEYQSDPVRLGGTGAVGPIVDATAEIEAEPGYREVFRIVGELPRGYWLKYELPVVVRIEGGEFIAAQPNLALIAFGESPTDAIMSLREELVEHFELLVEMGDHLGPQLKKRRRVMRQLFTGQDAEP